MKEKAKQIRERMRKRLAEVAQRMALVQEAEDEQFPPEYQVKRGQQRGELLREWKLVEGQGEAEINAWAQETRREADALYHSDPVGDPATESRRVSENMEIARLAEQFIGQPTMARNRLIPEVRRFISLGVLDKARIHLEAAKRAGVVDGRLDQALTDAYDQTVPHRKRAREQMRVIEDQRDLFDNDRYSLRLVYRVGSQVQASTAAKMLAARRGVPTPAGLLSGAHGDAELTRAETGD
jgi:hypothetical protein